MINLRHSELSLALNMANAKKQANNVFRFNTFHTR